jgi:hypothetical protein
VNLVFLGDVDVTGRADRKEMGIENSPLVLVGAVGVEDLDSEVFVIRYVDPA